MVPKGKRKKGRNKSEVWDEQKQTTNVHKNMNESQNHYAG